MQTVVTLFVAWIIGDSLRATDSRRNQISRSSIVLLVCIALAFATTPAIAQQINTPDEVDPHRLIRSEASCEQAGGFAWIVRRLPDGFRPDLVRIDGGKAAIWTGPPGTYEIDLICQVDGALAQAHARVVIRGTGPDPSPPGPGPMPPGPNPPEPDPSPDDVPADEFGNLGRRVFSLLKANASETFPAGELAALYQSTADRLTGTTTPIIPTVSAARVVLKEGHDEILEGESSAVWMTCRIEIEKVWDEHQRDMDRTKAARFIAAVGTGLQAFAD
ncbi:hypothetical protein FYK55_18490 [Roseiconus nitratireducens]|uniref:Uncharacterized protein n=1 Tax=Roseiconus nitratireducens TaxID=2605748 RepID=A0A5M6D8N3_9BACT|nr:hypothetical protein [Roseiconus nitratireducens]KAA5541545.1 hypothetical protein FYK55_18490 [Roseiconus nitratireducens]